SNHEANPKPGLITRREAILRVSALLGGVTLAGQGAMLAGCPRREAAGAAAPKPLLTAEGGARLGEPAVTILPAPGPPGARAAVGPFVAMMVTDCYDDEDQAVFREGLATVDGRCRDLHGVGFLEATPGQRLALVETLDAEQARYMNGLRRGGPAHWFRMMKELTLLGYFTSEIGYTQAMRYVETPGRYDPCVPWEPGEKIWAQHA